GLAPQWVSGRTGVNRSPAELTALMSHIGRAHPALPPYIELIVGLTEADPAARWSLKRAEEYLLDLPEAAAATVPARLPVPTDRLDRLIADGVRYLCRTMTPDESTLWPRNPMHFHDIDAASAWPGAAGVLATLTQAARVADASFADPL